MGTQLPSPKRGQRPQFSARVYCAQAAGWIKMPLGMEVGLDPGDIVLDGDPAPPPQKGHSPPNFWPMLWSNDWWIKMALGTKVGLGPGRIVLHGDPAPCCVTWRPSSPFQKGHSLPIFGPCLLWPNARPSHLLLSTCKLYNVATFVTLVSLMSVTALCCYTTRGYII